MIPGEKEFDEASNNPQLNFSKMELTNAKNESNSNISDFKKKITSDIPNDVDIGPNKNIDVEDGNVKVDLNKEESDQSEWGVKQRWSKY